MYYFDKSRLQQVLLNLLSNGVKFSHRSSKLCVFAELKNTDNGQWIVKISVLDQGIGITKEDQKHLFTPFYKSGDENSQRHNPNGNGLGLYMSKCICNAAGGSLEVESTHMLGSHFKFSMVITSAREVEEQDRLWDIPTVS